MYAIRSYYGATADQLAAAGFIVIAPDFLSGKGKDGMGTASFKGDDVRTAIRNLAPEEITRRLDAAAKWGTSQPAATSQYGVVGFCWGGGVAFNWAVEQPKLGASVVYYGVSPETSQLASVKAPVLGLYGGSDARVTSTVPAAQTEMKRLSKIV